MKIFAGGKLKHKNPPKLPASVIDSMNSSDDSDWNEKYAKNKAAIKDIPPAIPSILSIKLTALVIPTNQKIVSRIFKTGHGKKTIKYFPTKTKKTAGINCPKNFNLGVNGVRSSINPIKNTKPGAASKIQSIRKSVMTMHENPILIAIERTIPIPPSQGVGVWCHRSLVGTLTKSSLFPNKTKHQVRITLPRKARKNGKTIWDSYL
jgi:hypothetical protein